MWCIRFTHFFRQHFSLLPLFLIDHPGRLIFGGVSALEIIDSRNVYQLFLLWRLKILIWWNYQLFWYLFIQKYIWRNKIDFPYYYRLYIFLHRYHYSLLYFSPFGVFTLHIRFTMYYDQLLYLKYFSDQSNCTYHILYFIYPLIFSYVYWRKNPSQCP